MTTMLTILGIILAIAAEITVLQAEEASLATIQVSTQSGSGWHVVRSNVTVHGYPIYLAKCAATGAFCGIFSQNSSLTVNLIEYKGTYYYSYTDNFTIYEVGVSKTTTRYTAWFTNSTLYCVTGFPTAPIPCPS